MPLKPLDIVEKNLKSQQAEKSQKAESQVKQKKGTKDEKKPVTVSKLAFIALPVFLGMGFKYVYDARNSSKPPVLGTSKSYPTPVSGHTPPSILDSVKKEANPLLAVAQSTANTLTNSLSGNIKDQISKEATKPGDMVSSYLFDQTAGRVLDQFDKLPSKYKDEVKTKICK